MRLNCFCYFAISPPSNKWPRAGAALIALWETIERVKLCRHTLYLELLTNSFPFASTFKIFWAKQTWILIPTRFPRLFFQVSGRFQRLAGHVSSFCFRRCVACGIAMEWYHPLTRLSRSRAIRWPGMSRATEATTQHPLERSRRGPVELNHADEAQCHTHLTWWPSRAVLGWMGAHLRGALMSVRTLHAETSHCGLRVAKETWFPRMWTLDGRELLPCPRPPSKMDTPSSQKREEKLSTINYSLTTSKHFMMNSFTMNYYQ